MNDKEDQDPTKEENFSNLQDKDELNKKDWSFCPVCRSKIPQIQNLKFCIKCGLNLQYLKEYKQIQPKRALNPYIKPKKIKDNNLDKPYKPKIQPIICPNCNIELNSFYDECELCGWKKEICRRKALDKCGLVKMDENSCNGCGKYEKFKTMIVNCNICGLELVI